MPLNKDKDKPASNPARKPMSHRTLIEWFLPNVEIDPIVLINLTFCMFQGRACPWHLTP
jgi:hypothetical protein